MPPTGQPQADRLLASFPECPVSINTCGAPSSFLIQFSGTGTDSDNKYAVFAPYGQDGQTFSVEPTTSAGDATVFGVTNACAFGSQDLGFIADVSSNVAAALFFDTPGNIRDGGYITPVCSVSGGIMTCDFQGATQFALCPDGTNVRMRTLVFRDNRC